MTEKILHRRPRWTTPDPRGRATASLCHLPCRGAPAHLHIRSVLNLIGRCGLCASMIGKANHINEAARSLRLRSGALFGTGEHVLGAYAHPHRGW